MALLDTKTVDVATVLAAAVLGVIETIRFWDPVSQTYVTTAPANAPFGSLIGVVATMRNTGAVNQRMYMRCTLKRPDGTTKSTMDVPTTPVVLAPNATHDAGWTDFCDAAGVWTEVIELYGEAA